MKYYIKEMRVYHYLKNLMVFAPLLCSGRLFEKEKFFSGVWGFAAFSLLSSVVYMINDIQDIEKDRQHPTKKERPIAAGKISVKSAKIFTGILFCMVLFCNLQAFHFLSSVLLGVYLVLNLAYSVQLKNIPIVDITILVSGFLIRILYGAVITDISISNWLYLTVMAMAFYFALGKRRNEQKRSGPSGRTRKVLSFYPESFLDKNMYLCLALANVFYALWSVDEKTMEAYHNSYLIWTVPIVLLITMKYGLNIEGDSDGDPVEVLIHDKVLILLCLCYLVVMFCLLYL